MREVGGGGGAVFIINREITIVSIHTETINLLLEEKEGAIMV